MHLRALALMSACLFSISLVGCGEESIPEDAPKAPEAGSAEYDAYSSGSRGAPSSEAPAEKKE